MQLYLMDIKKILGGFLLGLVLFAGMADAKTCPSNLQSNLHEIGNLSLGGEFRFWYYYVDQYDYEDQSRFNTD